MKRWLKQTIFGAFGAIVLLGGLTACGHGGMHGNWNQSDADAGKMRERMLERAGKELQLDDAQKQRLATLADKLHEQRAALVGTQDPRTQFQALLAGPTFDRSAAQALVQSKTAALQSGSPAVIAAAGDFFDSLRPDQQQQVRDFLARRSGWGHRS
jgi:Spy/CpxP family protein refolding chaperone